MGISPQPALSGVSAYSVPRHPAPISLDLSGNLGPQVDPSIIAPGPDALRAYPDARPLEADLAARFSVAPEQVLVSAGADDAIDRICRAMLCPGRVAVVSEPGFVVTAMRAKLCGAAVRAVPWPAGGFPVEDTIAAGEGAALVVVTSPNNPTGASVSVEALRALSAALPDALLLVDLAYAEYDEVDLTASALALPNAVVTRTLSKAWGLAGLRVGYAIGSAEVIGWLRAAGLPYAVSQLALDAARRWLSKGAAQVEAHVAQVRRTRAALSAVLAELGAEVVPSSANFVFCRHPREAWLRDGLAGLGIGIRAFPGKPGVRLACPATDAETERLLAGLRTVLAPEAIWLGPVAEGWRGSPLVSAYSPGVRAWQVGSTPAEIAQARARGAVPIGVLTPGVASGSLLAAGAARELSDVASLEELL